MYSTLFLSAKILIKNGGCILLFIETKFYPIFSQNLFLDTSGLWLPKLFVMQVVWVTFSVHQTYFVKNTLLLFPCIGILIHSDHCSSHQTSIRRFIRNNVTSHLLTCFCNSFRWSMHLSCFGHAVNWSTGRLAIGLVIIWFKTYSFCVLLLFYVDTVKNKLIICRTS